MHKATHAHTMGANPDLCPATAPALPSPRRRSLLAGAAAALAAAPFAAHAEQIRTVGTLARDAGPDARLLADIDELRAMTARHDALDGQVFHLPFDHPRHAAVQAVFRADFHQFHALRERIARTPAATEAGAKAKAAFAIEHLAGSYSGYPSDDWDCDEALAYSALLDLVGRARA